MKSKKTNFFISSLVAPFALVFTASFAQAATRLWTGGSGSWTAGATGGFNGTWTNSSDNAVFSNTTGGIVTITNAISTDATSPSISFTGNGYTLSAITTPRVVTLGAATVNISVSENNTATIGDKATVSRGGNFNIAGTTATAGTLVVDTGGALTSTTSYVLGTAGTNVTLRVNGGSVTSSGTAAVNIVLSNSATATSTMTLDNGVVSTATTTANNGLQFRTGSGTFNLNGGILTTLSVADTSAGTSTFNFNGGTLRASGVNGGSYGLMSLVDVANVRNNGAIIDSNGFNVTVAQLLAQSAIPGDNAIDGGLEKKGAGSLTLTNSNTYTGVTKVSDGTLILGNASNTILNTAAVNVSGGILDVANNDTVGAVTLTSGTISGAGTLTGTSYDLQSGTVTATLGGGVVVGKSTGGVANLGGTQSYTAATNVTAGTLNVTGTLDNTLLTVSNNAILGGEGSTAGNVVLDTGSTLAFDPSTTGPNQYFKTTGTIDASAGGVKLALATTVTSGTGIVIAEAAGGWAGSTIANFTLQARGTAYFSGNQLLYDFGLGNLVWKGNAANPSFWDVNTTQNWDNVGSPDKFIVGDNATFNDSAATRTVVVQAPLTAGALTFTNTLGNDYTLGGAALAATSLSVNGSGKVSVSNAITLSGAATISAGTLQLGDETNATGSLSTAITNNAALVTHFGPNDVTVANAISGSGSLTQAGTGIVSLTGTNSYGTTTIDPGATLQIGSGGTVGTLGAGAVTNDGILAFNRSNTLSVSNAIGGSGALFKLAANALTLSVANGYTGATTISSGALIVTANGALGTNATGTTVSAGASLVLSGGIDYATTETLSGSGVGSIVISGAIAATQRGFIQSVSGNNTFRGNIELSANGVSHIGNQNNSSLTLTGAITQASGITTASVNFFAGSSNGDFITLSNAGNSFGGDTLIYSFVLVGDAGLRLGVTDALPTDRTVAGSPSSDNRGSLDLNGNDQTLNGLIASGSGSLRIVNLNVADPSTLTLTPTADKTSPTLIRGGVGLGEINLVKDGLFTQTLSGANSYSGATTVTAGTLALGASNVLPDTTPVSLGGATLNAATFSDTVSTLDVTGAATINLGTNAKLVFADSSAIDWTGGALAITGTLVLGGPNGSLRFGTTSSGLTGAQLALITKAGEGPFALDANGFLIKAGYSAWQTANSTTEAINLDHDNDGVSNGVEYFLGGTTNTTGFTPLPSVIDTAGVLSITWTKAATYTGAYTTDFLVETSATLNNDWATEVSPGPTISFPTTNEVKFTFPTPLGTKNFARLKVTGP